jgi:hypothetical protein
MARSWFGAWFGKWFGQWFGRVGAGADGALQVERVSLRRIGRETKVAERIGTERVVLRVARREVTP